MTVEDYPAPKVDGEIVTLARTLSFTSDKPVANLHFLAGAGAKIEQDNSGWYVVNEKLRIKIDSAEKPVIRQSRTGRNCWCR